ncbi:hypothetical protein FHP25_03560 [Vineibacter terrae]|uniref:DUF4239 domain-containing protein n=1 Tax=Vineibacter terrae TaxID=2586908 RepID=A0A5C8PTQ6_9HYPH|nr:hypothetical protein [Vineibacter terrae]TXL81617.1 hypothetical protein FHP25_03560 [Vineibacter terrae]
MQAILSLPAVVAVGLFLITIAALEVGYLIGRRSGARDEDFTSQLSVIRGAALALLTFLIGFAFSGAGSRYIDRLDMIVKEANAIGTAYLRTMVLPEPQRSDLQETLRQYTADRIAIMQSQDQAEMDRVIARASQHHTRMWDAVLKGVAGDPQLMLVVLPPFNDLIDLHTTHLSASRRHIPMLVLGLLVAIAVLGFVLVGYGNGLKKRRYPVLNGLFCAITATAFWMTIDLDRPHYGLIRASYQPYIDQLASMKP